MPDTGTPAPGAEHDLLYGIVGITDYIRNDLRLPLSARQVMHLIERDRIPTGRLGRRVIGLKSAIRETLVDVARGGRAA